MGLPPAWCNSNLKYPAGGVILAGGGIPPSFGPSQLCSGVFFIFFHSIVDRSHSHYGKMSVCLFSDRIYSVSRNADARLFFFKGNLSIRAFGRTKRNHVSPNHSLADYCAWSVGENRKELHRRAQTAQSSCAQDLRKTVRADCAWALFFSSIADRWHSHLRRRSSGVSTVGKGSIYSPNVDTVNMTFLFLFESYLSNKWLVTHYLGNLVSIFCLIHSHVY